MLGAGRWAIQHAKYYHHHCQDTMQCASALPSTRVCAGMRHAACVREAWGTLLTRTMRPIHASALWVIVAGYQQRLHLQPAAGGSRPAQPSLTATSGSTNLAVWAAVLGPLQAAWHWGLHRWHVAQPHRGTMQPVRSSPPAKTERPCWLAAVAENAARDAAR